MSHCEQGIEIIPVVSLAGYFITKVDIWIGNKPKMTKSYEIYVCLRLSDHMILNRSAVRIILYEG